VILVRSEEGSEEKDRNPFSPGLEELSAEFIGELVGGHLEIG
jgi:hypothetical protein